MDETNMPERITALPDADQQVLKRLIVDVVTVLETKQGVMCILMDKRGDGEATFVTCGDIELMPALLDSATEVMADLLESQEGYMQ